MAWAAAMVRTYGLRCCLALLPTGAETAACMAAYTDAGMDIWDNVGAEVIFSTSGHVLGARISERMRYD